METAFPLGVRVAARFHSRWWKRAAGLALAVVAAVLLRLTVLQPKAVPVTVFRAARGRVEETVTNSKAGAVKSRRRATLSSELGGRVAQLLAKKGARVQRGNVLLTIIDADYRAQVLVAESAVETARSARTEACR